MRCIGKTRCRGYQSTHDSTGRAQGGLCARVGFRQRNSTVPSRDGIVPDQATGGPSSTFAPEAAAITMGITRCAGSRDLLEEAGLLPLDSTVVLRRTCLCLSALTPPSGLCTHTNPSCTAVACTSTHHSRAGCGRTLQTKKKTSTMRADTFPLWEAHLLAENRRYITDRKQFRCGRDAL